MAQRSAVGGGMEGSGIVEIEHLWVPMPDGVRLAARLWRPARTAPVPAIVEAIPYGKRWGTRWRDEGMHPRFARRGFAALRLDVRGTGDSEGTIDDEYSVREQADLDAALAWLAAQPWCDGRVTVLGKSWGGFAALQAAARRPPPGVPSRLAAAVSVCASDDRYGIDAHYMGGCLLVENSIWGASFLTLAVEPPDPALVGPAWREMWHRRLAAARPFAATWLEHPWRDAYWRQGSLADRPEAVDCPVLAVGGWADAYTDAVPRLLAGLAGARQGIVGPWAHRYPHNGMPGPPVDFVELVAGWLDRRLGEAGRGGGPAAQGEPPLYRLWMPERRPPGDFLARWPGRWVAEEAWPSPRIETRRWRLAGERLVAGGSEGTANGMARGGVESPSRVDEARAGRGGAGGGVLLEDPPRVHRSPQSVGAAAGTWCPFGYHGDLPLDQADDDRRSLSWESEPLAERLELLGAPEVELRLAMDRPLALLAARLVDVAPDGSASRVTYGLFNLTHRDGHEAPRPLPPGEIVAIRLPLRHAAWAVPAGHRLRLALSTTYWPIAWPSPEPVTLTVAAGELALPLRPPREEDAALATPPPWPEPDEEPEADPERDPAASGSERDEASGELRRWWRHGFAADGSPEMETIAAIGLEIGHAMAERDRIRDDDPLSAEVEVEHHMHLRRGDWSVRIETRTRMTATAEHFRLETRLRAHEGERLAASRSWDQRIPRRLG